VRSAATVGHAKHGPSWWIRGLRSRVAAIAVLDILFVAVVAAINPDFVRWQNVLVIINYTALPAIVLVPTVFLLAAGRFDLSPDGTAALAGMVTALVFTRTGAGTGWGIAAGLGVGLIVGSTNGILIERFQLNPLITTLATWWITAGAAVGIGGGATLYGFPARFQSFARVLPNGTFITLWYALVLCVAGGIILSQTKIGSHVFAVGGNRTAARLNGIDTQRLGIVLYTLSGLASAAAGVLFAAQLNSAGATPFNGLALTVIAGAVIGGASIYGGRGSVFGGLLGLLLLSMLGNATIYVGVSPFWEQAIDGAVLLAAVLSDVLFTASRGRGVAVREWLKQLVGGSEVTSLTRNTGRGPGEEGDPTATL
jgi:ribose/xylose/arabinose/galactoside ABC-type transport system permease subunit